MSVFLPGEELSPVGGVLGHHTVKGCLQFLVGLLSLQMVAWREVGRSTKTSEKLWGSLRHDIHRNSMSVENLMYQLVGHFSSQKVNQTTPLDELI